MKFSNLAITSAMIASAQASVSLDADQAAIEGFSIEQQKEWFELAFKYRLDLEAAGATHQTAADGIKKELAEKDGVIKNSVDVLTQMIATNVQVEKWLGIDDLTVVKERLENKPEAKFWKNGVFINDTIKQIWDQRKR